MAAAAMAGAMWDADAATAAGAARERGDGFIVLAPEEGLRWRKATAPVVAAWLKEMKERHVDGSKLLAGAYKLIARYAAEPEPHAPEPSRSPNRRSRSRPRHRPRRSRLNCRRRKSPFCGRFRLHRRRPRRRPYRSPSRCQ